MITKPPLRTASNKTFLDRSSAWLLLGIGAVVLVFALLVGGSFWVRAQQPALDPVSLCPKSGPTAMTVILVDATDNVSPLQRTAITNRVNRLVNSLRQFEQVSIYSIDDPSELLKPTLTVCRPVRPEETSEVTGNKALAQRRFDEIFEPKLREMLSRSLDRPAADKSPIMEAVQAVNVASFQKADAAGSSPLPKRLIIVSDLLENGLGGSHYRGVPDFETFKRSTEYQRLHTDLEGVEVLILYVGRDDARHVQGFSHAEFWQRWLESLGASVEDIKRIEG